jgi:threonine dehydrogenase-like Zn-dependent dehydrogenase
VESNKIDLKPFVSHVLPFEEFQRGFELVRSTETMKVLLKP